MFTVHMAFKRRSGGIFFDAARDRAGQTFTPTFHRVYRSTDFKITNGAVILKVVLGKLANVGHVLTANVTE